MSLQIGQTVFRVRGEFKPTLSLGPLSAVAVTQLFRWPRGVLVDEFYSKADVIEALITSSFIPG
jgi:hypothetical protein